MKSSTRDWYYDFALEPMGEPVTTPVFFPQTHSYALLQNKLERSFIDKTNLLVLKGSHGGGKTVSAGASYANPHVWYQNALPMWQQYFGYGRQKPWLKGWFSVGDDNPALLEQQMLELAKRVDAQTLAKLNENGIVSRSIKQYLNWLPQGLGQLFTPLSIVNNDRQTLVNLRQYLEAHPGWFFVFDEVVTYEQVAPYLPTRGGVVILTTNNLGFPVKCDDVIAFNALSQEEGLAFARSFFSPDQAKFSTVSNTKSASVVKWSLSVSKSISPSRSLTSSWNTCAC